MRPQKAIRPLGSASLAIFLRTLIFAAAALPAMAPAQESDMDALNLADKVNVEPESRSAWKIFAEAAYGSALQQSTDSSQEGHRLSLDAEFDKSLAPGWRAVFADRLDMNWPAQAIGPIKGTTSINTFKDAYLSWQAQPDMILDFGRINVRYGVATGYNPTDFFKSGALRSLVSFDPVSLKENRQGSVMLRAQKLWADGSVTALFSPKLTDTPDYSGFDPDWHATNNQNRVLLALSQKFTDNLNPQFLLYKEDGASAQLGFNLTSLVNDATVAYIEWSGGRSPSLLSQAFGMQGQPSMDDEAFRNRVSAGMTYTTSNKISLTAEYQYNGAGLDRESWDALGQGPLPAYGAYRNWVQFQQDLPTKPAALLYGKWQDAGINHLDLSVMERFDAADYSRLSWAEARYHLSHAEFALQWQRIQGSAVSDFGAQPQLRLWLAVLRYYY